MKTGRFCVVLVILVASSVLFAIRHREPWDTKVPNPDRQCDFAQWDFGVVDQNGSYAATLEYVNRGSRPVRFASTRTSCGCLHVDSFPKEVLPGEAGEIELRLNTQLHFGLQEGRAMFLEADSETPAFIVGTRAVVRSAWIEPVSINIGTHGAGKVRDYGFQVFCAGLPDAKLSSFSSSAPWMTVEQTSPAMGETQEIRSLGNFFVRFSQDQSPSGIFTADISVRLEVEAEDIVLSLPVSGNLTPRARADPSVLVIGAVGRRGVRQACKIEFSGELSLEGLTITASQPFVKIESIERIEGSNGIEFLFVLNDSDALQAGFFDGIVTVQVTGQVLVEIPFSGFILGRS